MHWNACRICNTIICCQIQIPNSFFIIIVEVYLALKLFHRHSTFWNKLNRLRIPTGSRSWAKDYLEQIQLVVRAGTELEISRFQVRHAHHSATLPQCFWPSRFRRLCVNFFFTLCSLHRATDSCFLSCPCVEHYAGKFFSAVSIYSVAFGLTKLPINFGSSRLMNRWLPMVFNRVIFREQIKTTSMKL